MFLKPYEQSIVTTNWPKLITAAASVNMARLRTRAALRTPLKDRRPRLVCAVQKKKKSTFTNPPILLVSNRPRV